MKKHKPITLVCDGPHVPEDTQRTLADAKIQDALRRIERAQNELNEACGLAGAIIGMVPEWKKLAREAERMKKLWHQVNAKYMAKRGDWKVDSI